MPVTSFPRWIILLYIGGYIGQVGIVGYSGARGIVGHSGAYCGRVRHRDHCQG